jgi:hypothetical protein
MELKEFEQINYEPPKISLIKVDEILERLAPSISCSGHTGDFGGE